MTAPLVEAEVEEEGEDGEGGGVSNPLATLLERRPPRGSNCKKLVLLLLLPVLLLLLLLLLLLPEVPTRDRCTEPKPEETGAPAILPGIFVPVLLLPLPVLLPWRVVVAAVGPDEREAAPLPPAPLKTTIPSVSLVLDELDGDDIDESGVVVWFVVELLVIVLLEVNASVPTGSEATVAAVAVDVDDAVVVVVAQAPKARSGANGTLVFLPTTDPARSLTIPAGCFPGDGKRAGDSVRVVVVVVAEKDDDDDKKGVLTSSTGVAVAVGEGNGTTTALDDPLLEE